MSLTVEQKRARLERALAFGGNTHTVEDVLERVRENRAVCWPNGDSLVITEVLVFPRLRAVNYWLGCGDLTECFELQPQIDAWAIEQGCSVAVSTGRMGWLRAVKASPLGAGWKPQGIKFTKSLQP